MFSSSERWSARAFWLSSAAVAIFLASTIYARLLEPGFAYPILLIVAYPLAISVLALAGGVCLVAAAVSGERSALLTAAVPVLANVLLVAWIVLFSAA